ncbi:MAG: hypothetical protein WC071_11770 [Victivallaceae bacterium]
MRTIEICNLEKKISDSFTWCLLVVVFILATIYHGGMNISLVAVMCFFLFWIWRFRRNHITSINRHIVNLLSIATGIFILYFSFTMIYNYCTGNAYFYYMSDKIAIITAILSIPFFLPVYNCRKIKLPEKRFLTELFLMVISFIVLSVYCAVLWKNGFTTPFVA